MPTYNDLIVTVTARVQHEEDFTFPKLKEELAVRIRAECLSNIRDSWAAKNASLIFDDDGDIAIITERGRLYIGKDSLFLTSTVTTIGSFPSGLEQFAKILDDLFKWRTPLKPISFGIRLFVRLRFTDAVVLKILQPHYFFQCMSTHIAPHILVSNFDKLGWRVTHHDQRFVDSIDIDVEPSEFVGRYNRDGKAEDFPSFQDFALAAELAKIAEQLRPFVDPLIMDPTKIRGAAFLQQAVGVAPNL